MKFWKFQLLILVALIIFSFESCEKDSPPKPHSSVTDDFESGSIGEFVKIREAQWERFLANNTDLSDKWFNWFYVKMGNMEVDPPTEIVLKESGLAVLLSAGLFVQPSR